MPRRFRTGGCLAALAILLGACAAAPPPATSTGATSPAPSAMPLASVPAPAQIGQSRSPSPLATPAGLPAAFRHMWVGQTRSIPSLTPPAVESIMKLDEHGLQFFASEDWSHPLVPSLASFEGADQVRLRLQSDSAGCRRDTEGTYRMVLSPTGRAMVVTAVADACAARVHAITGSWTRSACPDNHLCLGDLDAGDHLSVIYTPFVPFADWHYDYGRFGYTTPEGWSNPEDDQDGYVLVRRDAPEGAGIYVFSDVLAHAQGIDPGTRHCRAGRASGVGSSARATYHWIKSLPGLRTSHDEAVTVGGLRGWSVDVSVDPAWKGTCGWPGEKPGVPLFVNAQSTPDEGFDWGINGHGRMRLFILELRHDRTLLIDIEAPDKATWDALMPEAMPIVDSFEFRH